jgi:hypothetical protein
MKGHYVNFLLKTSLAPKWEVATLLDCSVRMPGYETMSRTSWKAVFFPRHLKVEWLQDMESRMPFLRRNLLYPFANKRAAVSPRLQGWISFSSDYEISGRTCQSMNIIICDEYGLKRWNDPLKFLVGSWGRWRYRVSFVISLLQC